MKKRPRQPSPMWEQVRRFKSAPDHSPHPPVGVPFVIKDRPENVTESKLRMMAESGLVGISIGVESGDEQLRVKVLNRKTKTEVIEGAFRISKKYGVKTFAYNMVGLPGQDERSMELTWKFIRRIKPDGVRFNIFHPIRGTQLYDECVSRGLYDPRLDTTPYKASPMIRHDLLDDETIIRYHRLLTAYASTRGIGSALAFHVGRSFWVVGGRVQAARRTWMVTVRWDHSTWPSCSPPGVNVADERSGSCWDQFWVASSVSSRD